MELNGISRRAACIGVMACVLLALALRLCALGASLPWNVEPDGTVISSQVELIRRHAQDRDAAAVWRMYPHLLSEIAALIPERVLHDATLEEHLAQAAAPIVQVRWVVALISILGVPLTYGLARRFLSRGPALLATFLSATSLLTLLFAQQARPHAPAAALALLSLAAALRLSRRPGWLSCGIAGVTVGLSMGTLQSGALCALPMVAAWILRDRDSQPGSSKARWLAPLCAVGLAATVAWTLSPHSLPGQHGASQFFSAFDGLVFTQGPGDALVAQGAGHDIRLDRFDGRGFAVIAGTLISFETLPWLAALACLCLVAKSVISRRFDTAKRRDLWIVTSYVLPYFLVFGMFGATCERFCLPLIPFVACLAAAAWGWIAARVARPLAGTGLMLLALPSLAACLALEHLRLREDGPTLLANWIRTHVTPESERVLFIPGVDLPLARTRSALEQDAAASFGTPWLSYQRQHVAERWFCPRYALSHAPLLRAPGFARALQDPLAATKEADASLVALVAPCRDRVGDFATQLEASFQALLARDGSLECRVPPDARDPMQHSTFGYNIKIEGTLWTWELLSGLPSIGDTLEMYRLP